MVQELRSWGLWVRGVKVFGFLVWGLELVERP